jgi:hypothetical protein
MDDNGHDWQTPLAEVVRRLEADRLRHPLEKSNEARTMFTVLRAYDQRLRQLALRLDVGQVQVFSGTRSLRLR